VLYHDHAGEITAHFRGSEFGCRCGCGRVLISVDLVEHLEEFRVRCGGFPVEVTSGFRCVVRQVAVDSSIDVGGDGCPGRDRRARRSFHTIGQAADVWVRGLDRAVLWKLARCEWLERGVGGVGFYPGHVHLDRGPVREWTEPRSVLDDLSLTS
jgi:uncharacterized protein YcbK (DUF882 family)